MLDLLKATSELYGDCSQEVGSSDIYISAGKVTTEQMVEITNRAKELEAGYDSQAYARLRKVEYSKLNQDEMRYDDLTNNTTTWQDSISAIKVAIPKGVV